MNSVVNTDFWYGKRVFVTGHTGFKGSWLSLWLQSLGAEVKGFSLEPPTSPSLFEQANVADAMISDIGDIRELAVIQKSMVEFDPEIVIHMAAQPLVRQSYREPVETYSTNVMGTIHVFEAARKCASLKAIVNVTTDKCYENREWVWGYRENEPMGGHDPYSNSKGCSELVTSAYRNSFFNTPDSASVASARAGNVIGGGDWAEDRLIPDALRAFEENRPVVIRSPRATRPWQHVLEPLSGYLNLAEKLYLFGDEYAEAWNFGPNDDDVVPVGQVIDYLVKNWPNDATWLPDNTKQPHEAQLLKLDISKAVKRLQWEPVWSLDQALNSIVEWHSALRHGFNMAEITREQIKKYSHLMEQAK